MFWRRLLDMAAALHFLAGGHWASCRAVIQAHIDFRRIHKDFKTDRDANLAVTIVPSEQILSPINLLWQYYAKCRHTFNQLPLKENNTHTHHN